MKVIRLIRKSDGHCIDYRVLEEGDSFVPNHHEKAYFLGHLDPENDVYVRVDTHICEDYLSNIGKPVNSFDLYIPADVRQAEIDYRFASDDRSEGRVERWKEKARMRVSIFDSWTVVLD